MTPPAAPPDTDWSTFGAEINLLDGVSAMRPEKGWRAARGRRRRPVRRLWRRPLLWTLGVFAVLGLLSLIPAMGFRSGLERGR